MKSFRARALMKRIPGFKKALSLRQAVRQARQALGDAQSPFLKFVAPGHFYSPIPDINYVQAHRSVLFARDRTACPGVDLAVDNQIRLIQDLATYYKEMPFSEKKRDGARYYFDNQSFCHGSSIVIYCLMRHFQPRSIIEVGSGYSSAAMLDINDRFFDGGIRFTFIEPYPKTLFGLLKEEDKNNQKVCVDIAQNIPVETYTSLKPNDILVIDSSHSVKIGSDVVFLLSEILPLLEKGVVVHIHDVHWPFEYPEEWVLSGRAWNEAYLVKAFLQFNTSFEILLFNSYLAIHHRDLMEECLPLFMSDAGSSLWIRKTR